VTDQRPMSTARRARVLVVDDSPTALYLLRTVFESEHYEVVTATDGNEGLDEVRRCAPDLVVTDSVMPGLGGAGLHQRLRRHGSTVPFLLTTGYEERSAPRLDPAVPILLKPWSIGDLAHRVRTMLDGSQVAASH